MAFENYNPTHEEIVETIVEEESFSSKELQKELELSTDFGLDENFDLLIDDNDHFRLVSDSRTRIQRFRFGTLSRENIEMNSIGVAEDLEKALEKTYSKGKIYIERALKKLLNNFESLDSNSLEIDYSNLTEGKVIINAKDLSGELLKVEVYNV